MKLLVVLFLMMFFPLFAFAGSYEVTNAGSSAANGTYTEDGEREGETQYTNGTYKLGKFVGGPTCYWVFTATNFSTNAYYYQWSNCATPPDITRGGVPYDVDTGSSPGPILEEIEEPSGETATTTDMILSGRDTLFMGAVNTFLLSFIGIGTLFSVFRQKR